MDRSSVSRVLEKYLLFDRSLRRRICCSLLQSFPPSKLSANHLIGEFRTESLNLKRFHCFQEGRPVAAPADDWAAAEDHPVLRVAPRHLQLLHAQRQRDAFRFQEDVPALHVADVRALRRAQPPKGGADCFRVFGIRVLGFTLKLQRIYSVIAKD